MFEEYHVFSAEDPRELEYLQTQTHTLSILNVESYMLDACLGNIVFFIDHHAAQGSSQTVRPMSEGLGIQMSS